MLEKYEILYYNRFGCEPSSVIILAKDSKDAERIFSHSIHGYEAINRVVKYNLETERYFTEERFLNNKYYCREDITT